MRLITRKEGDLITLLFFLLQDKGFHISSDGLHVKTNRVKLTREEEVVSTLKDTRAIQLFIDFISSFPFSEQSTSKLG
jgi:hypothetical protein